MARAYQSLSKTRDFNLLFKHGFNVRGQFFDVKALELAKISAFVPKKETPDKFILQQRLAFSVGLKYSKKAVERNRLKRQLREICQQLLATSGAAAGWYALIIAKPSAKEQNFSQLSEELAFLLKRAKIIS
jgi:ribonuclease P protein component